MSEHPMLEWLQQESGRKYGNYMNGEWMPSSEGMYFPLYHAAEKNRIIGYFADSTEADAVCAVQTAHEAFAEWMATPGPDRAAILLKFADLLEKHIDELAYRLSAEQGKVLNESRGEVLRAAKEARFAAGEALRMDGQTVPSERRNVTNTVLRYPIGVVVAIAPWNFPVVTPVRKIAPALAYGCTVVFKPASATPWAAARLMELFTEAGVPKGVLSLVNGGGSRIGNALTGHPFVKGISFTGSTSLGLNIQKSAASRLARTQLELGGKNAALVLDYANLAHAAKQIAGAAFGCSGQRCTAISRVVVLKQYAAALTDALIAEIGKIRVGPAWMDDAGMGPLINESQLASVQQYIRIGQEEGATLACGGNVLTEGDYGKGSYMAPALFIGVKAHMRIAKEEIFGPVLTMLEADTVDEAIQLANSTEYGLASSVFTDDYRLAQRLALQLQTGMVHINHGTASEAHMPFGGIKNSGFGPYSIGETNREFYTDMKVIYTQY